MSHGQHLFKPVQRVTLSVVLFTASDLREHVKNIDCLRIGCRFPSRVNFAKAWLSARRGSLSVRGMYSAIVRIRSATMVSLTSKDPRKQAQLWFHFEARARAGGAPYCQTDAPINRDVVERGSPPKKADHRRICFGENGNDGLIVVSMSSLVHPHLTLGEPFWLTLRQPSKAAGSSDTM